MNLVYQTLREQTNIPLHKKGLHKKRLHRHGANLSDQTEVEPLNYFRGHPWGWGMMIPMDLLVGEDGHLPSEINRPLAKSGTRLLHSCSGGGYCCCSCSLGKLRCHYGICLKSLLHSPWAGGPQWPNSRSKPSHQPRELGTMSGRLQGALACSGTFRLPFGMSACSSLLLGHFGLTAPG